MVQASTGLTRDQLARLRSTFPGDIITPADDAYDEARRLWNAVHDRRPAVIVRPRTSPDVASAIRFAREHDLELAVRSGGHSPSGHSTCEGGLVVDMSAMRGVSVDPVDADGSGERRGAPRRARCRGAGAWARLSDRRRRPYGRGGTDARWRGRTACSGTSA